VPVMFPHEALAMKQDIRQKVLMAIASTIPEHIGHKMTNVSPAMADSIRAELLKLRQLLDRSAIDDHLEIRITRAGVEVRDKEVDFFL
jgi:hypothetical protein